VAGAPESEYTFVFADLAGYTAMTEIHGDEFAADAVAQFCSEVAELLPEYGAEEVKRIGDAVLLRADEAGRALALSVRIIRDVGGRHGALAVAVGMHTGPAVQRDGDWFGSAVNVASRVAAIAAPGPVLMTAASRHAAGSALDGLEVRGEGSRQLKNVAEPVQVHAITLANQPAVIDLPIDPVCRMAVDPARCAARRVYRGVELHFCSDGCAEVFDRHPERYSGSRSAGLELRVSDAAREQVVERLGRSYRRGRLESGELEQRVAVALAATTRGELRAVTSDLPRRRGSRGGLWARGFGRIFRVLTWPAHLARQRRARGRLRPPSDNG